MELPKVLHPMLEELKPSVASSVKSNDCFLQGRKKRQGTEILTNSELRSSLFSNRMI